MLVDRRCSKGVACPAFASWSKSAAMSLRSLTARLSLPPQIAGFEFGAPVSNFMEAWSRESPPDEEPRTWVQSGYLNWRGRDWLAYVYFYEGRACELVLSIAQLPWTGAYQDLRDHLTRTVGEPEPQGPTARWHSEGMTLSMLPASRGAFLHIKEE